jgi:hypothetical protein
MFLNRDGYICRLEAAVTLEMRRLKKGLKINVNQLFLPSPQTQHHDHFT